MQVRQTAQFAAWLAMLRDKKAAAVIAQRIVRVQSGLLGDVKPVGGGVSELRINFGPGYRVYFTRHGHDIILLLCGGDKGTQAADIRTAKQMASNL
jgi:putative addiction module killer protein